MKQRFLKWMDATLGTLVKRLLPPAGQARQTDEVRSILVIRPGGIGDAVLLLPMLQCLRRRFPAAMVELLAETRNAAVFGMSPVVARVWRYDRLRDVLQLLGRRYDLIIDSEQWYCLPAVVARLLRPGRHIGFSGNGRERSRTDVVTYDSHRWELLTFLDLLGPLGAGNETPELAETLVISGTARSRAASLLGGHGTAAVVTLFPGGSSPAKCWPAERFAEVARFLAARNLVPVVLGGAGEALVGAMIAREGQGINCAGTTTLEETFALIARSSLLITGDSGLLHAAALLGVPTVALFGPSDPQKWAPQSSSAVVVPSGAACAPCARFGTIPPCPHTFRCMNGITVSQVLAAIESIQN